MKCMWVAKLDSGQQLETPPPAIKQYKSESNSEGGKDSGMGTVLTGGAKKARRWVRITYTVCSVKSSAPQYASPGLTPPTLVLYLDTSGALLQHSFDGKRAYSFYDVVSCINGHLMIVWNRCSSLGKNRSLRVPSHWSVWTPRVVMYFRSLLVRKVQPLDDEW